MNNTNSGEDRKKDEQHEKGNPEFRDEFEKITVSASNQRSIGIVGVIQTNGPSFPYLFGLVDRIDGRVGIKSVSPERLVANLVDQVGP